MLQHKMKKLEDAGKIFNHLSFNADGSIKFRKLQFLCIFTSICPTKYKSQANSRLWNPGLGPLPEMNALGVLANVTFCTHLNLHTSKK